MKEILIEKAFEAMNNAYAPYSNYHVGACLVTRDGTFFVGANIENASFGATNCGERTAIFSCYAQGYRQEDIQAIAIVTDGELLAGPCGICRQVLSELMPAQAPIYLSNRSQNLETTIEALLPMMFGRKDLSEL